MIFKDYIEKEALWIEKGIYFQKMLILMSGQLCEYASRYVMLKILLQLEDLLMGMR